MAGNFDIELAGGPRANLKLERRAAETPEIVKQSVAEVGEQVVRYIQGAAPRGTEGSEHPHMADLAQLGEMEFFPGGAGGGGQWSISAGIPEQFPFDWPRAVIEGTGRFSTSSFVRDVIHPSKGNALKFTWHGNLGYAAYTKGQRPNRRWWDDTLALADFWLHGKLRDVASRVSDNF